MLCRRTSRSPGHAGVTDEAANVYSAACPTRQILDRISDKWAVLILILLSNELLRFNQLRRAIEGISQKMLYRRC